MASRLHDFETVTEVAREPAPASYIRRTAELCWTDAAGSHRVTLAGRAVAGSAERADLVLRDPTVSRLHAELEPRDEGVWLRDLGSTNGSFVQGLRVTGVCVPDGARIRLGGTELSLAYAAAPTQLDLWPEERFGPLLGRSVAMRELFARLARVAASDATVLIQGETGTGKELVARAIHEASARAGQPLVVIDCAALPETLLEAELFGHAKGAFTGATSARVGAIEAAEGGTVFLDEIGELPLAMQPKLLRAIEARTIRRVGEVGARRVNVRFLSATHRDLRTMVNAGAFREDLYFRLAVVPVVVPPLRSRSEDVGLLVSRFMARAGGGELPAELVRQLESRAWLGNVRELRNFVERAVALGPREALALTDQALAPLAPAASPEPPAPASLPPPPPPSIVPPSPAVSSAQARRVPPAVLELPFKDARERWIELLEREYVAALLERHGGNVAAAAQAAGIDRSYVHRLLRRHSS